MASERRWTIRDYAEGDERAIVGLFEQVFGRTMGASESAEHWRWEFARNPSGPQTIELVWDGDRLVGQYAVSPRRVWFCGAEQRAALSLDTMTHPDYGRQGIFSASAEACYARMVERGFAFVYGFPNANSIHGFEKYLRWKTVMPTPVHVKPLDLGEYVAGKLGRPELSSVLSKASRLLLRTPTFVDGLVERARSRGARPDEPLVVREFADFEELAGVDELWLRCRDQHRLWVIRDRDYLRWRYDQRPESEYLRVAIHHVDRSRPNGHGDELVGWAVLTIAEREQGRTCFIMDLLVDAEIDRAMPSLLRAIEALARARGCALISAMVGAGSRWRMDFLRHAYLPLPERLFPQELYFGARVLAEGELDRALLLHPESWQLGWGDIDVI
ncbi:GNAT family N-acetyltransferase [Nannocystaceae bacterium ST9]